MIKKYGKPGAPEHVTLTSESNGQTLDQVRNAAQIQSFVRSDPASVNAPPISGTTQSIPTAFGTSLADARLNLSTTIDLSPFLSTGEAARAEAAAAGAWHIANTTAGELDLNIGDIWDDYTGRGVTVGVYDSGIEASHPDLDGNYNASLEFAGDNPGPDYTAMGVKDDDAHGTAVAGIIAAEQNGAGTVGIAYGARLTSVDTSGGAIVSNVNDFISGMSRFDIVNHSTGFSTQFQNEGSLLSAYESAVSQGRGGRGTIIVQSANNDRSFGDLNADGVQQSTDAGRGDANADAANNGHLAIVVGSVNETGRVDSYSSPGANLLVSAFGTSNNVVTTDLVGANGYTSGDYTGSFSGTSAAAPMVSGVVALMLDANPNLGWRDVQQILALTARQVGSEMNAPPTGDERFSWSYNKADNWNGGGMHFSNDYGYGLVDAHAAVRLAESWTLQSTSINEQVGVGYTFPGRIALTEANTVPHEFKITINDSINTESISLWLNLDHSRMSDLRIEIRSPEGTWSVLTDRTGLGGADFAVNTSNANPGWTFTSNAFRGETAKGEWTIRVWDEADSGANDNGTISGLILRTYGSAETVNDQLYYTDEYGAVWSEAVEKGNFGRLQITDTDGGTDTINAAATTSDAQIDLNPGQISLFGGGYAQVALGSVIENAFGGDGNDILYGNEQTNLLKGNRGNDEIYGRGGADSLSGDQGDDILNGGTGGDHIHGGFGKDTASYENSWRGVQVVLGDQQSSSWNGSAYGGDATGDRLYSIENLTGSRWMDRLTGNKADNILNGGGAADVMAGGAGNDTYYVDNIADVVDEEIWVGGGGSGGIFQTYRLSWTDAGGDHDHVITSLSTYDLSASSTHNFRLTGASAGTLIGNVEDLTYNGTGKFTGIGNNSNNIIRGGAFADVLIGGIGHDTLYAGLGNDSLYLGLGDDKAYIDNGTEAGGDVVCGEGGYDCVYADNSTIGSGLRLNLFNAGTSVTPDVTSVAYTSSAIDVDYVEGSGGNDVIDASRLTERIIVMGGEGKDIVTGGTGNDSLAGGGGDDTLRGGLGSDSYHLGKGENTAYIDNGTAAGGDVINGADGGYDIVAADESTTATGLRLNLFSAGTALTPDVVSVAFTSAAIDVEKVVGNFGNDLIDASRLARFDGVWIESGAGNDTVISGASSETFDGGGDFDTIVYAGAQSEYEIGTFTYGLNEFVTIQNIATQSIDYFRDVELAQFGSGDALTTVDLLAFLQPHIVGTEGADQLIGTDRGDLIEGLAGDDTIAGGLGNDRLLAGDGHDVIIIDADDSTIDGGAGRDAIRADASADATGLNLNLSGTNVEYVDASNAADVIDASGTVAGTLTEIDGHGGDDTVIDGPGSLWFYGGDGEDSISFSGNLADYSIQLPVETEWAGWTLIIDKATGLDDWVLDVETLKFADQTIGEPTASTHILGTSGDDVLTGTDGIDVLKGGDGADELRAGAGNDALYIDNSDTVIDGGDGWDVAYATETANRSGLNFKMAGTSIEAVWSGMGDDLIDTLGLERKDGYWYQAVTRSGDDRVIAGDHWIYYDGGAGRDTLVLSGSRADYDVALVQSSDLGDSFTLAHKSTGAVASAFLVESFEFNDLVLDQSNLLV